MSDYEFQLFIHATEMMQRELWIMTELQRLGFLPTFPDDRTLAGDASS